jgi:hypothetical protein
VSAITHRGHQFREGGSTALLIDRSQRATPPDPAAVQAWAAANAVFLSSEMGGLRTERQAVAGALRDLGLEVVMFEDLGGRDEDARTAYIDGVARTDIYVGLVADRYGTMLPSGRSPTHEEYREARRRGLHIAVWVAADGSSRQGDARDFIAEVRTFHTTGSWEAADALVTSVVSRMRQLAGEEDSPWIKLGKVAFRASSIADDGRTLTIEMRSRDGEVLAALEALRPDGWGRPSEVSVTTAERSGAARVTQVISHASSAQLRQLTITAEVQWADGRRSGLATGINGVTFEEQVELSLRAGLFGEPLPERLGMLVATVDSEDPLSPLDGHGLPQASFEAVARLLVVERLIGSGRASRVADFTVGPAHQGMRAVHVAWCDALYASNVSPAQREISGRRVDKT